MNRTLIAHHLLSRLTEARERLTEQYAASQSGIGHFVLDDLLPEEFTHEIFHAFPPTQAMRRRKSIRELKYVAAQMNRYAPVLEEAIYAFQVPAVVRLIGEICGVKRLYPDEHLYAGGISVMGPGHFLHPHLDNSHDKDRARWRAFNLLFYVTPDWRAEYGGNLELWPDGTDSEPVVLQSRFNRLVVMATHNHSWHSVSQVCTAPGPRCCVSNYYFSNDPLPGMDRFHVTSFRGRPEQGVLDRMLRADTAARQALRKLFRGGLLPPTHLYDKSKGED